MQHNRSDNDRDTTKIRTITSKSGRQNKDGTFFPAGMQPYEVAEYLRSDLISGLNKKQLKKLYSKYGSNIILNEFKLSFIQSLKNQIKGLLIPLLIVCSLIMYAFEKQFSYLAMSCVITLLILLNAFLESRASKALNVPRKYSSIKATVTREDVTDVYDSRKLVPGDIIFLSQGMVVPCDARLIDDNGLSVLETPVNGKLGSTIKDSIYIANNDKELVYPNMVYAGSIVTSGESNAIVCFTSKDTLLRRITGKKSDCLPAMLKYIQKASKYISITSIIACFTLLFIGVICARDVAQIFIISLSIGAISLCDTMASLAAASLGYGAKNMSTKGTVLKNLNCIPTLCNLNTIMCSKNTAFPPKKMTFNGMYCDNNFIPADRNLTGKTKELLYLSLACSNIKFDKTNKKKRKNVPEITGKIYDKAITDYLLEKGYDVSKELGEYFKIDTEYSLSGEVLRTLVLLKGRNTVILKGAPEFILSRCSGYELNGTGYKMSSITKKRILAAIEECSQKSGFIIAIAAGETVAENLRDITAERRLMFKGFITLYSTMNVENASAVYKCNQSGIETVVSSSDSYYTAYNMAKNTGIITSEKQIISAEQMYSADTGLFIANCPNYKLFLNFSNSEWLQILKYRKQDKRIIGATAEQIEELSLMNKADVSFVPINAPDTLKQSADVLMLTSGFDTLTYCMQNARLIFVQIHSIVEYLTVGAATLFLCTLISLIFGLTIPFRVQEILFGGVIFNLFFASSLAFSPSNRKLLLEKLPKYKARPSITDFLTPITYSLGAAICIPLIFGMTNSFSAGLVGFTVLLFLYAFTNISRTSIFKKKAFKNTPLFISGVISFSIMAILFFAEPFKTIFSYTSINYVEIGISFGVSGGYFIILQLIKLWLEIKRSQKREKSIISKKV